jgi:hypothetical protein
LPTNTGAPGTVENTVSVSVVVLPAAIRVRLELGVDPLAELDRAPAALNGERDGNFLDRDDLANELRELGDRPALLAGVDGKQRVSWPA